MKKSDQILIMEALVLLLDNSCWSSDLTHMTRHKTLQALLRRITGLEEEIRDEETDTGTAEDTETGSSSPTDDGID